MPKKETKIGIIIVNYNTLKDILNCLESLKKAGYINFVTVVDNNSSDSSLVKIAVDFPQVKIIPLKKNLGFAGGNNHAISLLLKQGFKFFLLLNPDTIINSDTINFLLEVITKDTKIGVVGPKIFSADGKIWSGGGKIDSVRFSGGLIGFGQDDSSQYNFIREVDFISGTAMLIRKEVFQQIGLFEEKYFLYYEDVEFCYRAKKEGFKIIYVPTATVIHQGSVSLKKNSPLHQYYMARNHFLFTFRNAPYFIKLRELLRLPKTVFEHLINGEYFAIRGIYDFFTRKRGQVEYRS